MKIKQVQNFGRGLLHLLQVTILTFISGGFTTVEIAKATRTRRRHKGVTLLQLIEKVWYMTHIRGVQSQE
jgi:hypothetical protein